MNKRNVKKYWREHKKEILIGVGVTVVVIAGCVFVYRYAGGKQVLKQIAAAPDKVKPSSNKATRTVVINTGEATKVAPVASEAFSAAQGERFTATKLGDKVLKSGREINKRLVDKGLLNRAPCGDLYATEAGKQFCNLTARTQPWGYEALVYEWDESVLGLIFTPEELAEIARKQQIIATVRATA